MKNAGLAIFIFTLMFLSVVPVSLAGNSDEADAVLPGPDASGSRAGGVNNESVTFKSGDCDVPANLYYPSSGSNLPAVVFGVGYAAHITSLFESSNYGWLGEGLASRGYVVLVVRYCANYSDYMDLINIAYDYSLWVNETRDAVTALIEGNLVGASVPTSDIVDAKRVALGGHSIGGAVSIVSGALDRRVKCVFVMSPQNFAGTPRMNDHIDDISPVPIQLQVGEEDMLVGVTTVQQSYDAASIPKEIVKYRYGTYEGFTDLGKIENIEVGDLPSAIREVIRPYIQENPLSTKQHAMSINFTRGFLDYYLENEQSFNIKEDYSEDFVIPGVPPVVPPTPVTDVWHATVAHEGLDDIFHGLSALPEILDYSEGDEINLRARITPRGIYETGVKAVLTFPEGTVENYDMAFNDDYDTSAGDFRRTLNIPITHDLGTVQVIINATNDKGHTYTSDPIYFTLTTTSDKPVINSVDITPSPMVPGEVITFTVSASDKDGIAYYSFDFGNGTKTGWIESNTAAHTYKESGHYTIRIRVKDSKAQESNDEVIPATVSHRPVAKLKVDSSVHKGEAVDFDASASSDEDGDDLEYFF
ncbi:MAG: PKD domain-containing protein, partial [Thermoplasmata archaeon]|nr:PKD domain-containing protein [Thermoplasmata archaeon]